MPISDEELIKICNDRQSYSDLDSWMIYKLAQEIMDLRRSMREILPLMDRIVDEDCGVQPCYSKALMAKMKIRELLPIETREEAEQKER